MSSAVVVLGSRSPRRRQLLESLLPPHSLQVRPPLDTEELDFSGVHDEQDIERRLLKIVTMKLNDVQAQLEGSPQAHVVLVADTIVIAAAADGRPCVLGQPSAECWQADVRVWLRDYLSGTVHQVWTAFLVASASRPVSARIVKTQVSFAPLSPAMIEWYIHTGESPGKAGGYAIQGHAAAFVCGLQGSLTNVIGLPQQEVAETLQQAGVPVLSPPESDGRGDSGREGDKDDAL